MTNFNSSFPAGFWTTLREWGNAIALIDEGEPWTYKRLALRCEEYANALYTPEKSVVFVFGTNNAETIALYLGGLIAGHAVHISTAGVQDPEAHAAISRFAPDVVAWIDGFLPNALPAGYHAAYAVGGFKLAWLAESSVKAAPLPALALLLGTSGSTGASRMVRLSTSNVAVAAEQVVHALRIHQGERALLSVPVGHIYGMSVLHSHLAVGACVVLENRSPTARKLWQQAADLGVTTIPGVSLTFEYMERLGVDRTVLPRLRKLTHSGGPAHVSMVDWMTRKLMPTDCQLFLMYGQTETTGRIAVLPPEHLHARPDSVGLPVRYGGASVSQAGEIIYSGPNVMLGYATSREGLALPDTCHGTVQTGDSGRIDRDGFIYITGRLNRSCKIFGQRIELEEVEGSLRDIGSVAAIESGGKLILYYEGDPTSVANRIRERMGRWRLPPQCIELRALCTIPRGRSGKTAYGELANLV